MGRVSRFVKNIFLKEYQTFAKELGFNSWDDVLENTYEIFKMPPDASYLVTQSKEDKWIVWNDEGSLPYSFLVHGLMLSVILERYLKKVSTKNTIGDQRDLIQEKMFLRISLIKKKLMNNRMFTPLMF